MNTAKSTADDNIICRFDKNNRGYAHASGNCQYNGCRFVFNANVQRTGPYRVRGRVTLFSSETGTALKVRGPRQREILNSLRAEGKEPGPETFSIMSEFYVKTVRDEEGREGLDESELKELRICLDDIRQPVLDAAERLYTENILAIEADMQAATVDNMKPSFVVYRYHNRFLNNLSGPKIKQETRRRKERQLKKLAAQLDKYTMSTIPQTALSSLFRKLGKDGGTIFRLAEQFWNYCLELGIYHGQNPFTQFLLKNNTTKRAAPDDLQRKALAPKSLPEKVERLLNQALEQAAPDDTKSTGLLLIKEVGFSAVDACNLRWDEVHFNEMERIEPTVQFAIQKEFIAGATHDYTRPGTPFCAEELGRRAEFFRARWGTLNNRYVLEDGDGKRLTSNELTAFCREQLFQCGMVPGELGATSGTLGIGVRLLLANYKNRITYLSGTQPNDGAAKFLQGLSLSGNVTADHYCSMTSPEAQEHLLNLQARDKSFARPLPDDIELVCREDTDGKTSFLVHSKEPQRFNRSTVTIRLEPGQSLEVMANCMLQGHIIVKRAK